MANQQHLAEPRVSTEDRLAGARRSRSASRQPFESENGVTRLLTVLPSKEDHEVLRQMLPSADWNVRKALTLPAGLAQLRANVPPQLILCESDLLPGSWKDILDSVARMSDPPLLIVTSRLADERLWAEALNLGAYDVLAKPFEATEVRRILGMAWSHWQLAHESATRTAGMG